MSLKVGGRGDRWFYRLICLIFIGLAGFSFFTDGGWMGPWFGYLATAIVWFLFGRMRRGWMRAGFKDGYHRYRMETIERFKDARRLDMTPDEWFLSEIERATGIVVIPPYDPHENGA
jgi:hypothetical protein